MVKKLLTYGTPKRLFVSGSPKRLTAGETGCECCVSPCEFCQSGTTPKQIQVTWAGIVDGTCNACSELNGTFICDQVVGTPCRWRYAKDTCTGFHYLYVAATAVQIYAKWCTADVGLGQIIALANFTWGDDCRFDDLALLTYGYNGFECNGSSSTCVIKSL